MATASDEQPVSGEFHQHGLDDVLLRSTEVAAFLGVSRARAYALMADGTLPAIRIGRSVRVSKRSLERWVSEREEASQREVA